MGTGVAATVFPLDLGEVSLPAGHPQEGASLPIVAHAIRHADGVLLFDTGVGSGDPEVEELCRPRRVPLEDALALHGLSLADVTAVANCHLHFDHAGQNARFAGVPIFVQAREHRMLRDPDYTVVAWVDVPGARYVQLNGEADIAPGVRAVPTPGHTPGHQSLVVDAGDSTIVLAGQAVLTAAEWRGSTDPAEAGRAGSWDEGEYTASVRRLRALEPDVVRFAHDRAAWRR